MEEQKEVLKKLCSIFCVDYMHNVSLESGYSDYKVFATTRKSAAHLTI